MRNAEWVLRGLLRLRCWIWGKIFNRALSPLGASAMVDEAVVDAARRVMAEHEPEFERAIAGGGWDDSGLGRMVSAGVRVGAGLGLVEGVTVGGGAGAPAPRLDFGGALGVLRDGGRVSRAGWNGRGMWVFHVAGVQIGGGPGMRPYLALRTVDGSVVPWVASQTDLLGVDWEVVS